MPYLLILLSYTAQEFQQFLGIFQQYLTLRILLPPFVQSLNLDEGIAAVTRVIGLLCTILLNLLQLNHFF